MCSKDLCSERSREGSSIVLDSSGRMPTQLGKAITNQPSLPLPKPGSHPPCPGPPHALNRSSSPLCSRLLLGAAGRWAPAASAGRGSGCGHCADPASGAVCHPYNTGEALGPAALRPRSATPPMDKTAPDSPPPPFPGAPKSPPGPHQRGKLMLVGTELGPLLQIHCLRGRGQEVGAGATECPGFQSTPSAFTLRREGHQVTSRLGAESPPSLS